MKQNFLMLRFYCEQLNLKTLGDLQAYKKAKKFNTLAEALKQMQKDYKAL